MDLKYRIKIFKIQVSKYKNTKNFRYFVSFNFHHNIQALIWFMKCMETEMYFLITIK